MDPLCFEVVTAFMIERITSLFLTAFWIISFYNNSIHLFSQLVGYIILPLFAATNILWFLGGVRRALYLKSFQTEWKDSPRRAFWNERFGMLLLLCVSYLGEDLRGKYYLGICAVPCLIQFPIANLSYFGLLKDKEVTVLKFLFQGLQKIASFGIYIAHSLILFLSWPFRSRCNDPIKIPVQGETKPLYRSASYMTDTILTRPLDESVSYIMNHKVPQRLAEGAQIKTPLATEKDTSILHDKGGKSETDPQLSHLSKEAIWGGKSETDPQLPHLVKDKETTKEAIWRGKSETDPRLPHLVKDKETTKEAIWRGKVSDKAIQEGDIKVLDVIETDPQLPHLVKDKETTKEAIWRGKVSDKAIPEGDIMMLDVNDDKQESEKVKEANEEDKETVKEVLEESFEMMELDSVVETKEETKKEEKEKDNEETEASSEMMELDSVEETKEEAKKEEKEKVVSEESSEMTELDSVEETKEEAKKEEKEKDKDVTEESCDEMTELDSVEETKEEAKKEEKEKEVSETKEHVKLEEEESIEFLSEEESLKVMDTEVDKMVGLEETKEEAKQKENESHKSVTEETFAIKDDPQRRKIQELEKELASLKEHVQKLGETSKETEERYRERYWEKQKINELVFKLSAVTSRAEFYRLKAEESKENVGKLEEEKNDLIIKLCAANASSELYRSLLHDLELFR